MQPAIKAVFQQLFGVPASWDPAVLTKWKEIMVGNHDDSIRDFSENTPEQFDSLATQLESRANTLACQLRAVTIRIVYHGQSGCLTNRLKLRSKHIWNPSWL